MAFFNYTLIGQLKNIISHITINLFYQIINIILDYI